MMTAEVQESTNARPMDELPGGNDETLRLLIGGVKDYAILMLDPQGRITSWNIGAERIKGYRAEEIVGQHFSRFYPAEDVAAGKPARALEIATREGRFEEEGWRVRKDGSRFLADAVLTAIYDDSGELRGFGKVTRDITERKEAEEKVLQLAMELERSQVVDRLRQREIQLKEEFLSHVSHELRSPLTSIYSFSTLIVDGLAGDMTPQQEQYLRIIMKNVEQLLAMIEDLLEDTLASAGRLHVELQRASLAEGVVYAVDTLRGMSEKKQIDLSFSIAEGLPAAYADPMRLRQVLTILLDNAVKYTPPGGSVQARAGLSAHRPGFLLAEVADTGPGIRAEAIPRIFERLYQAGDPGEAGRRGLGLGLHIAKGLVHRQAGDIWVESELGKGCRFFFTVPVFAGQTHAEQPGRDAEVAETVADGRG